MLKLIGTDELIAMDDADYVRIALETASSRTRPEAAREKIKARSAGLFGDARVVDAFAAFLAQ